MEKYTPLFISPNKGQNIIKYCIITSTVSFVLIALNTILISQKSTRNSDTLKIEIKNLSSNLDSLEREIKNISLDLAPSKRQLQRWNKCFKIKAQLFNKNNKDFDKLNKSTKESLAVTLCNRTVNEPSPK